MRKGARVLKFTRSDQQGYVLVNAYSRGSKPLDLQLEATEGDEHYGVPLRHDKVSSLRIQNCPSSELEWGEILRKLFQQDPQPDINVTATVRDAKSIDIVVRKEIQGITQRLGEISIGLAKKAEYNILDWCATAVDVAAENKGAAVAAENKVDELEATIADLKNQLAELITAKAEDETSLLSKFRDLLNEKKVKIREQQKVIVTTATATDSPASSAPGSAQGSRQDVLAGKSRAGKRKAQDSSVKEEDTASDEEFERMEVDRQSAASEPGDTDGDIETDATASTASDEEEEPSSRTKTASKRSAPQQAGTKTQPPAPRSLPFAKAKPKSSTTRTPARGADSETESNDEL